MNSSLLSLIFSNAEIIEEVTKAPLNGKVLIATVTGTIDGEDIENMPDVFIYLEEGKKN